MKSKEEAIEWATRFMNLHKQHWPGWEGEIELRQLMEFGPPASDFDRVHARLREAEERMRAQIAQSANQE